MIMLKPWVTGPAYDMQGSASSVLVVQAMVIRPQTCDMSVTLQL